MPPPVSVAYGVMVVGLLVIPAWLLEHKHDRYRQEKKRDEVEVCAGAQRALEYKDSVDVDTKGKNFNCVSETGSSGSSVHTR